MNPINDTNPLDRLQKIANSSLTLADIDLNIPLNKQLAEVNGFYARFYSYQSEALELRDNLKFQVERQRAGAYISAMRELTGKPTAATLAAHVSADDGVCICETELSRANRILGTFKGIATALLRKQESLKEISTNDRREQALYTAN